MFVSINWIKEFVDLSQQVDEDLAKRFTLATCEVEEVKTINQHLAKVVIAQILKIENHPDSEKLHLVTIDIGSEQKTIVCGAPNVKEEAKVPFAPLGTTFPNGLTLEPKKIRGVLSEGMLCSEAELEIGEDDSGLKIFPADAPVGTNLNDYLNRPCDILFDIDNKSLTNRPDLWSQYGMAREFATVFKKELKNPFDENWEKSILAKIPNTPSPVKHSLQGESACKGYWGLSISGIKVEKSPVWMQNRLLACGLRPINSIVDISNYVLLELGMPNHIFDRKYIQGNQIIVKKAGADLTMTTLDESERKIIADDTLICDANRPLAIAGIMGGLESSITDATTDIFIECANFTDANIRKTSTRLGLRSDSSLRFEKSLDTHLLKRSILRIAELILEFNPNAKIEGSLLYEGEDLSAPLPKIKIELQKISSVLGKEIECETIIDILTRLGFGIEKNGESLTVSVPSWRATKDINGESDIIEEIGRIIGFDNITPEAPLDVIRPTALPIQKQIHRKISDFLVLNQNALEVMSYPMIGKALLTKTKWDNFAEGLVLVNAISTDHDRMRPSIVPSLLETLQLNSKNDSHFTFFEIGRAYSTGEKDFSIEENYLGVVFYDKKEPTVVKAIDCVESLLSHLKLNGKVVNQPTTTFFPKDWLGLHPYEHLSIQLFGKTEGAILSLHPLLKSALKIKGNATLVVLRLSSFENNAPKSNFKYSPLPKFQGSEFDCTVVTTPQTEAASVVKVIQKLAIPEVSEVKIVGTFNLSETEKTVTTKTKIIDSEKNLDGAKLEEIKTKIVSALQNAGFPLKQ